MTDITWGPERTYYGSGECPADARDVPCMVKSNFGIWSGITLGRCWYWGSFTAYRLPIPPADPVLDALVAAFEDTLTHLIVLACMVETNTLPPSLAGFQSHIEKARAALALAKGEKP